MTLFRGAALVALLLIVSATGLQAAGIPITGRVLEGDERVLSRTDVALEPILTAYDRVLASELRPEVVNRVRLAGANHFDLRLELGFEVSGKVTDPDGNTAAGAGLWLLQTSDAPGGGRCVSRAARRADGGFTLEPVLSSAGA